MANKTKHRFYYLHRAPYWFWCCWIEFLICNMHFVRKKICMYVNILVLVHDCTMHKIYSTQPLILFRAIYHEHFDRLFWIVNNRKRIFHLASILSWINELLTANLRRDFIVYVLKKKSKDKKIWNAIFLFGFVFLLLLLLTFYLLLLFLSSPVFFNLILMCICVFVHTFVYLFIYFSWKFRVYKKHNQSVSERHLAHA